MFDFLKRHDVHLSPEVHGRVTLKGKPMANLKVIREITFEDGYLEITETDEDGRFFFPEKNIKSRVPGKLFNEIRTRQVISVEHENEHFLLWHVITSSITSERVLIEKLQKLDCDLTASEEVHYFTIHETPAFTHNIRSICRWDNDN